MVEQNVIIRLATAKDKKTLSKIKNNAFPFLMRFFFSSSKDTLVAEKNGEVVGGAVLKIFNLKNKKCGHVLELFVSKKEQNNGLGKKLVQASLAHMKTIGCEEVFACVEGNNTGSSNIFSKNGFAVLSLYDQIKNYGFSYFKLLYNTFHIFDIGHFLWKFPANQKHFDSSAVQFLMSILLNIIVFLIACLRINNSIWTAPGELLYVSAAFSILFIVRFIFMITASKVQRIPVRFRLWESGITRIFSCSRINLPQTDRMEVSRFKEEAWYCRFKRYYFNCSCSVNFYINSKVWKYRSSFKYICGLQYSYRKEHDLFQCSYSNIPFRLL